MDPNAHRADVAPSKEEMAAGMVGLEVAGKPVVTHTETAPAPVAPVVAGVVRWLTDKKMSAEYTLLFPLEVDGVECRLITIRRMTGAQVAGMMTAMRAEPGKDHRWPMFFVGDQPMSDALWDALDDDDRFHLGEMAASFLPARFKSRSDAPTESAAS